jgi:carboxymethylenebutenolidase
MEKTMKRNIVLVGIVLLAVISNAAFAQKDKDANPDAQKPRRASAPFLIKTAGPLDRLQKSPRHHEFVEIESPGGRKVKTWIVYPQVDHPATVVVLIHENRGLTDWVRSLADEVAEAGYVAVAPDLLSGTAPGGGGTAEYSGEDKAIQAIYSLKQPQVTADLDAVFDFASKLDAGNKVVAVAGFCWGGGQTFAYATHNPKVASSFVFYGTAPKDEASYKNIKAPVYGFYGGDDFRITGEVPKVEKLMKSLDKKYEPVIYKGAQHAFMRQGEMTDDPKNANREARDQAFESWKKALAALKPGSN